jgi:hypothetical protein
MAMNQTTHYSLRYWPQGQFLPASVTHFCRSASGREATVGKASARFSSAFFLLLLAAICTLLLGFVLPLCALSGVSWAARPDLMMGGLVFSLVLFITYFYEELINYGILHTRGARDHQRRRPDRERERIEAGWMICVSGPFPSWWQLFLLSA